MRDAEHGTILIVVDTVMVRLVLGGAAGTEAALLFEREAEWAAPSILMSELHNVLVGRAAGHSNL